MGCKIINEPDRFMIVCSRGTHEPRCKFPGCGNAGVKLCDFPTGGKTCDMPTCAFHSTHVGPDTDYCWRHDEP